MTAKGADVWLNGKCALRCERAITAGRPFALGGSWQKNSFRNVELGPAGDAASGPEPAGRDSEAQRRAERKACLPLALPAAGRACDPRCSLDGDWLLKPAPDRPAAAADPPCRTRTGMSCGCPRSGPQPAGGCSAGGT